jgi:hypothetical protein
MIHQRAFGGAKILLHYQGALLTYLRDEKPDIPFRALWDLPGGAVKQTKHHWNALCGKPKKNLHWRSRKSALNGPGHTQTLQSKPCRIGSLQHQSLQMK